MLVAFGGAWRGVQVAVGGNQWRGPVTITSPLYRTVGVGSNFFQGAVGRGLGRPGVEVGTGGFVGVGLGIHRVAVGITQGVRVGSTQGVRAGIDQGVLVGRMIQGVRVGRKGKGVAVAMGFGVAVGRSGRGVAVGRGGTGVAVGVTVEVRVQVGVMDGVGVGVFGITLGVGDEQEGDSPASREKNPRNKCRSPSTKVFPELSFAVR